MEPMQYVSYFQRERQKKRERERVCERGGGEERNINLKRERYIFS